MILPPIIESLTDNDMYKYSMGQAILHQFPGYTMRWAFKCRDKDVHFTPAMVQEIKEQVQHYCTLKYKRDELNYLSKIRWLTSDYISYLRHWSPVYSDFMISEDADCGLAVEYESSWLDSSPYESPVLSIINEVYFKMKYDYDDLIRSFKNNLDIKFENLKHGRYYVGTLSDFGMRRRLSKEAQEIMIRKFIGLNDTLHSPSRFVGTSDVYFAYKYGILATGTKAHEWTMGVGQGDPSIERSFSNRYDMAAWVKEYKTMNGIALTDTITTDVFLKDFNEVFANLFSGCRHDSGDPFVWGDKIIGKYESLGIDPKTKTLIFSDSLNFDKATEIFEHFRDRVGFGTGIGTFLTNDTHVPALNIVLKPIMCNGMPVAKISDAPGKGMCRDEEYIEFLRRSIDWRMKHAA